MGWWNKHVYMRAARKHAGDSLPCLKGCVHCWLLMHLEWESSTFPRCKSLITFHHRWVPSSLMRLLRHLYYFCFLLPGSNLHYVINVTTQNSVSECERCGCLGIQKLIRTWYFQTKCKITFSISKFKNEILIEIKMILREALLQTYQKIPFHLIWLNLFILLIFRSFQHENLAQT